MQLHASCAARRGVGVLIIGPPGSGKSRLVLKLIETGFLLVADDRVELTDAVASAPTGLRGLIEVRGLGLLRLPYLRFCRVHLVAVFQSPERFPSRTYDGLTGLPSIHLAEGHLFPRQISYALSSLLHPSSHPAGAFA